MGEGDKEAVLDKTQIADAGREYQECLRVLGRAASKIRSTAEFLRETRCTDGFYSAGIVIASLDEATRAIDCCDAFLEAIPYSGRRLEREEKILRGLISDVYEATLSIPAKYRNRKFTRKIAGEVTDYYSRMTPAQRRLLERL